jgi:hypothetical protein
VLPTSQPFSDGWTSSTFSSPVHAFDRHCEWHGRPYNKTPTACAADAKAFWRRAKRGQSRAGGDFEASEMAEAVKYTWRVMGIELDVTPWINPNTYLERDESRFETRPVASTRLPAASAGRGNDFYCLCERIDAETEKRRGAR